MQCRDMLIIAGTIRELNIEYDSFATVPKKILEIPVKISRNTLLRCIGKEEQMLEQLTVDNNSAKGDELKKQSITRFVCPLKPSRDSTGEGSGRDAHDASNSCRGEIPGAKPTLVVHSLTSTQHMGGPSKGLISATEIYYQTTLAFFRHLEATLPKRKSFYKVRNSATNAKKRKVR